MDKRAAVRFPTDLQAECRTRNHVWPARLCNISATGCMLACPEDGVEEGELLRLRVRGLPFIDAKIVWAHRGHAGIRFVEPLRASLMERLGFRLLERAQVERAA